MPWEVPPVALPCELQRSLRMNTGFGASRDGKDFDRTNTSTEPTQFGRLSSDWRYRMEASTP